MTGMTLEDATEMDQVDAPSQIGRWGLIRKLIMFQFKLAADGVRDLVLSPLSLIAGLIGILFGGDDPAWAYRRLMSVGHKSDRWINLFDTYGPDRLTEASPADTEGATLDAMVFDLEEAVRRDFAKGGVTAYTRGVIEERLNVLKQEIARRHKIRRNARGRRDRA